MYTEEERAKWRQLVARWKAGEKVFDAGKRIEKTDATTVQRQEPVQSIKRNFIAEAQRKHVAEAVGPDTRSSYQRKQSQAAKQYANQQYQKAKDDAKRAEGLEQMMKTVSPSTYVEAATGQDLGTAGRLIIDAAAFGLPGAMKSIAGPTMQYGRNFLLSQTTRRSLNSGVRGIQQIFSLKNKIAQKVENVDFDNIAKLAAKMKADDDAWMAMHPEYNIKNAINKTKLPNAYESFPSELIRDVAKDPYYDLLLNAKTSADVAKISPTVRSYADAGSEFKLINEYNPFVRGYTNLKSFLQSPAYRKRLENYYKQKGSSYVTINNAPDDRIGEQLYNIETAKATVRPPGHLVDENGTVKDSFGLYDPNSHSIQVAADALRRQTPEHEMWHAARRAMPYLDNTKYRMRVKSTSLDPDYYNIMSEQEVRVLDTLREMQEHGLDINNLTDDQIWNFLMETPADMHGTNVQSLIDNYWYDDVKNALRNFKGLSIPITMGIGYTKLKPIQTMKSE